ncbi:hypothetical protein DM860_014541 [Cuscuta australis]|uniref:Uncharacterized protein n=1 Tax=Cuscuta australis TaxID=267555 RepID=A0A328E1U7_9ASTE|nr:hypothetical protein DM860_014541 [Cuscuta australis]
MPVLCKRDPKSKRAQKNKAGKQLVIDLLHQDSHTGFNRERGWSEPESPNLTLVPLFLVFLFFSAGNSNSVILSNEFAVDTHSKQEVLCDSPSSDIVVFLCSNDCVGSYIVSTTRVDPMCYGAHS